MRNIFNQFQKRCQRKQAINQLEELVQTKYSKMYRIALNYTYRLQDTLDVLQTSFNKALKAIDQQPDLVINDPVAWYYRTLINSCCDFWRTQQHQPIKANFELEK
ncbi:RNA polymerase sigma factor [Liquorilactobacillus sicerae]|uniref:RNA polymerase sigma factor n=1 Tax=Liquorilactobacillus sicerae TaxID=1416943 RepID=UPI0024812CA7|nr:sigma factor [Liquorilactobacillus sicerae]